MNTFRITIISLFFVMHSAWGQTPPAPERPTEGEKEDFGLGKDLSKIPKPEADKKANAPEFTEEEKKAGMVDVSILAVGYVPPPIIKLDSSGMPREVYRNPMEYPPSVYWIKTAKTSIKVIAAQNQVGPSSLIPRSQETQLSYEDPPDFSLSAPVDSKEKTRSLGKITIPQGATHILVVVWKNPEEKFWNSPSYKVLDMSPANVPRGQLTVVNSSRAILYFQTKSKIERVQAGYMGGRSLPMNSQGDMLTFVGVTHGEDESRVIMKNTLNIPDQTRGFLVAWDAPRTPATPEGILVITGIKSVAPPKLPEAAAASNLVNSKD